MTRDPTALRVTIRPYDFAADRDFVARVTGRLDPGETASPRDRSEMAAFFAALGEKSLSGEPGSAAFVAEAANQPLGLIAVHADRDAFTRHPRAYVDILVVAEDAEGKGVGRALLEHVEDWARARGFREVVLDVFATKTGAIGFYERCGYRADHIRMAKPLG